MVQKRKKNNYNVPHVEMGWEDSKIYNNRDYWEAKAAKPLRTNKTDYKCHPVIILEIKLGR